MAKKINNNKMRQIAKPIKTKQVIKLTEKYCKHQTGYHTIQHTISRFLMQCAVPSWLRVRANSNRIGTILTLTHSSDFLNGFR